ncbi:MAG: helix-turn-helix domain-containing protein [Clostridia bacterium]|nr:helix-turn-helix domain-containing protein [Clostridia bacterium]
MEKVRRTLADGRSIRAVAKATGVSTATVQRVKRQVEV